MSEKKRRRHKSRSKRASLLRAAGPLRAAAAAFHPLLEHPLRSFLLALFSFFLCWAVLTKSLPYVFAETEPEVALALNPKNPVALVSKAGEVRERLLSHAGVKSGQPTEQEAGAGKDRAGVTIASLPKAEEAAAGDEELGGVRDDLRKQLRALASRAIASDPLNATAYRLLAETASDPARTRSLMQEAVKRSRRETAAVFWLLNDSYYRRDFPHAIEYLDVLLRTKPEMASYGFSYLLNMARDPDGRRLAANHLAGGPRWRREFLTSLWDVAHKDQAGPALLAELRNTARPPELAEIRLYISYLVWNGAADAAYNLWLETLPRERAGNLGFLTDPGFEETPGDTATAFDWAVGPGGNMTAGFVPSGRSVRQRLLHLSFGEGRIEFPIVRQALLLPPGHYRLTGQLRGSIVGKRGLRWQLSCATSIETVLGETEMLMGESEEWRVFTLDADIPDKTDCVGQLLRLYHDARTPSEEYLSGEAWFGGMQLERTARQKSAGG